MITRVVRMEFQPDKVEAFLTIFNESKHLIRHFPGVHHLELHRDAKLSHVFYTYSIWDNEEQLNVYRHSELFQSVWAQTKQLFAGKPLAYSLVKEMEVE